jgi:hypothetical protein
LKGKVCSDDEDHQLMDAALAEAWGEFLAGYPWDWFVTLTFREPPGSFLHIHALMLNTSHLPRMAWLNEWNRRAGFARILPFDAARGAAFCCSKYVTKQFGDYDFSENIQAFKASRPAVQSALFLPTPTASSPRSASTPLACPSKPKFKNTAEDPLITDLDGTDAKQNADLQIKLIPEDGEDR